MTEVMGGGVVLVVAAVLWLVYLMPTWMSRRQYISTERNAVRLQQTLRILAETSEIPREVRLEATARDVAAQQRLLRSTQERSRIEAQAAHDLQRAELLDAEAKAAAAAAVASAAERRMRAASEQAAEAARSTARSAARSGVAARRRVRRARALSSLVLLASISAVAVGGAQLALGGSVIVLVLGTVGIVAALLTLSSLARSARSAMSVLSPRSVLTGTDAVGLADAPVQAFVPIEWGTEAAARASVSAWTPQPLPKPLYMQRGSSAAQTLDAAAAGAELRAASAESQRVLRAAALHASVTPIATRSRPVAAATAASAASAASVTSTSTSAAASASAQAPAPPTSRFASMGLIGETAPGRATDLDAVLRRRRASA